MKIELKNIKVRDVVSGYMDNGEAGVVGYGGQLDIRPAYQREFIYDEKDRNAVIKTLRKNFPLNTMYWAKTEDGKYELMDGQQRTVSICQYITDIIPIKFDEGYELAFNNLTSDQQEQILNYELSVYVCEGEKSEKLDWFRTINIAGKPLTEQELLNAMHTGPWLADAKRHFSKSNGPAYNFAKDYVSGSPIRQDYLETALKWISEGNIERYMSEHQQDQNANELWIYFQAVINWVKATFPNCRKEMKSVDWGKLYNAYKEQLLDTDALELETVRLMTDEDVTKKSGIYAYLLTHDERYLSIRGFTDNMKREAYERQKGICIARNAVCGGVRFDIDEMEADHITPWAEGGKTNAENCQMICREDNRRKSSR